LKLSKVNATACVGAACPDPAPCAGVAGTPCSAPKELKCGITPPYSDNTPMEPKEDKWEDQCDACKIRACNSGLKTPNGDEYKHDWLTPPTKAGADDKSLLWPEIHNVGCRCMYQFVYYGDRAKGRYISDCKNPALNTETGRFHEKHAAGSGPTDHTGFRDQSGEWKQCGAVRTCDEHGAGGKCVHPSWSMRAAGKAANPNVQIVEVAPAAAAAAAAPAL